MRLRMEIQTDLNTLGERRDKWVEKDVKAHGLELTTVELVEYIACYCLLEDLRFDVTTGNFAKAVEEDNGPSPSGINEVLNKLEQLEKRLEEVQLGKGETARKIPPLSHKELSALMEMDHKPQWVCRLLVFFKAVLDGQKVDPQLMECTSAWKSSDLQEELVMSPEKAKISDVWTLGAWLEAITAPMDGSDGGGGPPIPAVITNYVEGLWFVLVSAMETYGESYHQHSGSGPGNEAPKEVGEPPEIFGDTTVPVEEVRSRLASLRSRFSYENGRRIGIPKNDNQQRTDMTDPPWRRVAAHARAMGRRARSIGFLLAPTTSDGVPKGGKNKRRGGQSVQFRRERWREWLESRQTGHHGGRHGDDPTARTPQSAQDALVAM